MQRDEAVREFAGMLRLGASALRRILSDELPLTQDLNADLDQVLSLADTLETLANNMRRKVSSARLGQSY